MPTSLTWDSIVPILIAIIAGVAPTLVLRWFDRSKTAKETDKLKAEAENEEA